MQIISIVPNCLSIFRILISPLFVYTIKYNLNICAITCLIFGALSDFFDGYLARRFNVVSKLGELLDPLSDKIFTNTVLWSIYVYSGTNIYIFIIALVLSIRDLAYKTIQVRDRIAKEKGKEPGIDEIAKELDVEPEDIAFSLDAIQDPVSLQEPVYNDGTDSIYVMDQVKDVKNTDELWAENITIMEAMKKLNDKEKTIVNKRFFDGKTQMEVAEEIGISQAQVSRLEKSAIERIKRIWK